VFLGLNDWWVNGDLGRNQVYLPWVIFGQGILERSGYNWFNYYDTWVKSCLNRCMRNDYDELDV